MPFHPSPTAGVPEDVWSYTTRILTNLSNARAALIDTIPTINGKADTLLTRLSAARATYLDELAPANLPTDIATLLTRLSATRATYLDSIPTLLISVEAEGTLTADGNEQEILNLAAGSPPKVVDGIIDLANMQAGDTVVAKEYVRSTSGGAWRLYATTTYTNVQSEPGIYFERISSRYGSRVTLQQTGGTNRTYPYLFMKEG